MTRIVDQTTLCYVTPGKYTFNITGAKTVLVKGIDNKHQITTTFSISMSRRFCPVSPGFKPVTSDSLEGYVCNTDI